MSEKPVALLMGAGISPVDYYTPDEAGKLIVEAGIQEYEAGRVQALAIMADKVVSDWVDHPPRSFGLAMVEYLRDIAPHIPEGDIYGDFPWKRTNTREELRKFRQMAQQHGWRDHLIICSPIHARRVSRNVKRIFHPHPPFHRTTVRGYDDLLQAGPNKAAYIPRIAQLQNTLAYHEAVQAEWKKNLIDTVPVLGPAIHDGTLLFNNVSEHLYKVGRFTEKVKSIAKTGVELGTDLFAPGHDSW